MEEPDASAVKDFQPKRAHLDTGLGAAGHEGFAESQFGGLENLGSAGHQQRATPTEQMQGGAGGDLEATDTLELESSNTEGGTKKKARVMTDEQKQAKSAGRRKLEAGRKREREQLLYESLQQKFDSHPANPDNTQASVTPVKKAPVLMAPAPALNRSHPKQAVSGNKPVVAAPTGGRRTSSVALQGGTPGAGTPGTGNARGTGGRNQSKGARGGNGKTQGQ